ncbi:Chaperone protein TorD [Slackia heliotrinireducens]|uniref:Uncharacterized component of anaerobic dehydrogenase n=1 Tax=Slackia heliotrinireducens (strain ATCC 29202 / DSM 20476 / NCTC 11029 / RHS 1) TaxID=471855 RepID=C7N864_SLAHD|nr:molecular chaperone TorD family protein [Slackia heliotrinireducens]ACV23099.1 uncharacterized component of anaerobic dehydrogenase [Slackia heliotrinireducens DSM 20476]VEH02091.1 Chaperone protein TorD [Slackia heliotrinireducens]
MDNAIGTTDAVEEYTTAEYLAEAGDFLRTLASTLYKELSQDQIDALAQIDFMGMSETTENAELSEGFHTLGRYLRRRGVNARQDLAVEYARIFLAAGVTDENCATPYESVFTSPEGLLMQDARDQVVKVYRSQGFKVDPSLNDPEDHLAFELQFLAGMCDKTRDALEEGLPTDELVAVQVDFIDAHILNWIDRLTARVDTCATLAFYTSVMRIIKGYIVEHRAILSNLIAE